MGLERYLCVGGIEVANPNRTLAYLRNLGNPCLPTPPGDGCCTCSPWEQRTPGLVVVAGMDTSDPDDAQTGIYSVEGTDGPLSGPFTMAQLVYEYDPCGGPGIPSAPPLEEFSEPVPPGPVTFPLTTTFPYGSVEACGFSYVTITHDQTGATVSFYVYNNLSSAAPGNAGSNAVSNAVEPPALWPPPSFSPGVKTVTGPATPTPFTTPFQDDAPWYDPAVPASADVLGVWLEEVRLGSSHQRAARPRASWGSTLGATTRPGRELTLVGWVYARTEAATAYARQWLYEALAGESCSGGSCDLPTAEVWTHCDEDETGMRQLRRVGLTSWDPEVEPTFPRACGFKFEAVLTSEVPWLTMAPFDAASVDLMAGIEVCNICTPCPDVQPTPITCGCLSTPLREAPAPTRTDCFCSPIQVRRIFLDVTPPRYWSDAVAVITVDNPDGDELHNLRVRGWVNPVGIDPPEDGSNPWECMEPCLDVEIACVPARSELIIDGTTRRSTLTAAGRSVSAAGYLSSSNGQRFSWPEVSCHGLVLAIDADAFRTPENARVRVEFVTRERG